MRALGVVGDPQRLQVPRRHDVLRVEADLELVDDLQRRRVDHVDVVRLHVAARRRATARRRPPGSACRRRLRCRGCAGRPPAACRARSATAGGWRRRRVRGAAATAASQRRQARRPAGSDIEMLITSDRLSTMSEWTRGSASATRDAPCESRRRSPRRSRRRRVRPSSALARRGSPVDAVARPSRAARRAAASVRTSAGRRASISDVSASPACVPISAALKPRACEHLSRSRCSPRGSTRHRMHAHRRRRPFAVEARGHGAEALLVAAVIAEQHDVAKAVRAEAARRAIRASPRTRARAR